MLKIREFSKLSRISVRMLRHYDEIGLRDRIRFCVNDSVRQYDDAQI